MQRNLEAITRIFLLLVIGSFVLQIIDPETLDIYLTSLICYVTTEMLTVMHRKVKYETTRENVI